MRSYAAVPAFSAEDTLRLLVVEDDVRMLDLLSRAFREHGHSVQTASNGNAGLSLARSGQYDVIVLDIGLPGCDGWQIASSLRAEQSAVGIVMLTARDMEDDVVHGLDMGADEYVCKPFSFRELLARVSTVARRAAHAVPPVLRFEDIQLDCRERRLFRANFPIHLSPSEFTLMEALMRHAGNAVSRDALAKKIWGPDTSVSPGALDTLVSALRAKMYSTESRTEIRTVRGLGYALQRRGIAQEPRS